MKLRLHHLVGGKTWTHLALRAFTLTEVAVATAILTLAVGGLLAGQLAVFRLNAFISPKVENARYARQTLGTIVEEVRCANSVQVGTGTISSFTASGATKFQGGNAVRIFTTTNLYIYYFTDTNTAMLKKVALDGSTRIVAAGVTNRVVFTMEDFTGHVLTNSQNNAVMSILLQMRRGWAMNGVSDSYQLRTKITRRNIL